MKKRPGEKVGSGIIVMGRIKETGHYSVRKNTRPFEHPSIAAAKTECERLSTINSNCEFHVLAQVTRSPLNTADPTESDSGVMDDGTDV